MLYLSSCIILFIFFLAYLERGEYNVILVDWGKLSAMPWYITAVKNTRKVGFHVAKMISWLDKNNAVSMKKIHVIGFSLGAEVAGFIGKSLSPKKVIHKKLW